MNLTQRQSEFVSAVARLCNETGRSVGCTDVARAMGVTKTTAFETLNLLSERDVIAVVPYGSLRRFQPIDQFPMHFRRVIEGLQAKGYGDLAAEWERQLRNKADNERRAASPVH